MKNLKSLIINHKSGFTLIEVLVVIGVFATVGIITSAILVTSLRGNNKTNTIIDVKEEGNRALFFITQTIRYAKKFNGVVDSLDATKTDCTVQAVLPLTPTPTPAYYKGVKITAADDVETTFTCCSGSTQTIASLSGSLNCPAGSLLNTDRVSVEPSSCYFTCSQQGSSDFPLIGIHFNLNQADFNANVEKSVGATAIPFETAVTMRNLYK